MPMAGCDRCGRVETVPGHPQARIGAIYTECPECGRPLRWMRIVEAVSLVRKGRAAELRRSGAPQLLQERV
jgi:predicted nucleic acid-binding Zn ribbon protein